LTERKRLELKEIIERRCIEFGDFPLSSGARSDYYYDLKNILLDGSVMSLLGDLLLDEISKFNPTPKSVGGLETSAISIASAVTIRSYNKYTSGIQGFFVRKVPKTHGSQRKIEGNLKEPVVIVDDVLTRGNSIKQAIDAIQNEGKSVAGVICIIDREDPENVLKDNTKYSALFIHSDFEEYINKNILLKKLVRNLAN
jgi:orotate phosphoribosyltransferase